MAKVNGREDALLQAYLSRYKAAQDSAVTGGQKNTQKAQRQGSAILNATDKTLPSLGNPYESTLKNIVGGVSTENSLNLDFMNRQVKLAKAQYDAAQDYAKQMEKAQSYAAKAAAKATKRRTGKGNTAGQNTSTDLSDTAANALNGLNSSGTNTKANSTKPSNNAANRKKKPSAQEQYLADKASGKRKVITSNSYAERSNAAQPTQSRAVTKGGKVIGSSYAAAGSAPSASERTAAKQRQERVADRLQKLQTDASYRAELAAPGRKLDSAEVEAVNQYVKNTKNTGFSGLKRVIDLAKNSDNLSKDEYAKKSAELNAELNQNSALRGKAQGNGAGQSAQAFTAGLYDSVPFLSKASDAMASAANATGLGSELPMLTKTLEDTKTYDPVAATLGTMAGKAMQYNLFNTLAAGTKYGKAAQAAGGKIGAAAQKIPGLGALVGDGFGDAAGRVLADTGADFVLDTLPSLASDVSEGKSAGEVAGNAAKNLVGNVAMNALPEIGGAVFNRIKGAAGDAAQDAAQVAKTQETPAFYLYTVPADDTLDYTKVIQDVSADAQRTAAQRTRAQELQELLAQQAEQDKAAYAAKQAEGNSADLPIDGATGAVYNKANGGVLDENLGGVLPGDVSLGINHLPGAESESGDVLDFVSGQYGAAGAGKDTAMPDAAKNAAQSLPLNGSESVPGMNIVENAQSVAKLNDSESVHPNTVGSKEREMPYQEYAGRGHSVTDIDRDTLTPENQNILGTNAPYTVQRVSHAEQQANAQKIRSNEGLSATIDRIVKDSTSGNFTDETETLAGNTLRELNEKLNTLEPNTTEYAKTATQARIVRSKMREGLTKTARTLESAKQFTTPEKAVMNIEGILSDARDAAQKKNPGAFKKAQTEIENAVEGGRREANAQLGEIVTNELSKIVGAGKQAAGNGNAGQAANVAKELPVLDNPEDAWARAVARKTGNYAQDNLRKADPDDLFAKEIVNQLFETAKESPVAQGARVKNGYTAQAKLNLAFDAQDNYAAVWNKAKAIAQKNYKNNPDMTDRLQAFFDNVKDEGSLYSNKTVLSAFTENLKENDDTFRQLADRAAFGNKSEISRAANRLADAVEVPDKYRSSFLKTAESVLASSKQLTGAQAHADGRAFRAALNRAGFTVGDIADASAFGNDISPVMAAHEIMETLNPPAEYRQTVFDNVYNYIKNNDGYQKQMEKADNRVLRRLVGNVDGGYTSIANKAAFGSDAGMRATVSDFLDEINAPTSLRAEMGERLKKAITGNTQYQKAAAGADSRVFNEAVRHVQEELEFTFQKLSGESDASKAKVLDGLKNTITDYLGVDDNQAAEVVQNIEKMYNSALSDGAMKRLAQIFPDTNKTANAPRDQFLELLRSGAYNDEYMGEAVKDLAATKFGIQQLSDEQVANIKQLAEQMETLPKDSKARVDIENEIATIAAGNVKGSFWDKWNAMRYTGMLFNAVTNIKNAVNNVGQGTLALLKDGVNGAVQRVAKAMGNDTAEITVGYLNPASKADRNLIGRSFADADNSRWRQLTGTSENFEMAKAARNAGQTFNTRVMRTIDQMSSAMLEDADVYGTSGLLSFAKPLNENNALRKAAEFAQDATKSMGENGFIGVAGLKNNYSRYLASYLKAHGATDAIFDATDDASKAMLENARDYAVQQALVNTYHEEKKLVEFIGKVKKSANDVPILGAWVEGQLPFVKTPTNVGIQAWRYSPGGLLQGLLQMGYDAAKGKDINEAMDTFSAGLTGSAIAGLGAYLWSTGHLVPGMTDEEKAEADLTGAQENSLQFTDENGKLHSYTINWFSNWAGPMMVGANLAKMLGTRNDTGTSVVDKVLNACVSVLDPVIDNSYLSGLNNTIEQLGNAQTGGEKAAALLTSGFGNYFMQAIPTLSGQLARTVDPTRRSTYTGLTGASKNFAYFGQKSENKIPVLSKSNEPYIDVWGNEEKNFTPASGESASDYAARAAYNFLSPGYYSESDGDEVSRYVEKLYKSTGDKNVLPKNSSARGYTVSIQSLDGGDSTDHRLTPHEKTVYDKTYGQTAYDIVDSLRQNSMFLQLPEDQQSALVQDAYKVAKTAGGVAAVGDGVSGTNTKAYKAYEQGGIPMLENYLLADSAIKDAGATKQADVARELLNSGLDSEGIYNSYILKYPKDQKAPAVYSQYGADGAKNWLRYQAAADMNGNGRISQDEARAVLDAMNLTDAQRAYYYLLTNSGWSAKNNPYGGA